LFEEAESIEAIGEERGQAGGRIGGEPLAPGWAGEKRFLDEVLESGGLAGKVGGQISGLGEAAGMIEVPTDGGPGSEPTGQAGGGGSAGGEGFEELGGAEEKGTVGFESHPEICEGGGRGKIFADGQKGRQGKIHRDDEGFQGFHDALGHGDGIGVGAELESAEGADLAEVGEGESRVAGGFGGWVEEVGPSFPIGGQKIILEAEKGDGIGELSPIGRGCGKEGKPSLAEGGLEIGKGTDFGLVPGGGGLLGGGGGLTLEGDLEDIGSGGKAAKALEEGGDFGGVILGRGGEALELLAKFFLLGGGSGGGGQGLVLFGEVAEGGGEGDGAEGPEGEEAKEEENSEQTEEGPLPKLHGGI
jgi:hypothetical protein